MKIPNKIPSINQALDWNSYLSKSEYTNRRLTFGKYINVQIKDLPLDYLEWGVLNLQGSWQDYFLREWKRRNSNWRTLVKNISKSHHN